MPKYFVSYYSTAKNGSQSWCRGCVVLDQPITDGGDLDFAEKLLLQQGSNKQLVILNWQRFEEPAEPEIAFHSRRVNGGFSLYISREGAPGITVPMSPIDADALALFFGKELIHS